MTARKAISKMALEAVAGNARHNAGRANLLRRHASVVQLIGSRTGISNASARQVTGRIRLPASACSALTNAVHATIVLPTAYPVRASDSSRLYAFARVGPSMTGRRASLAL